MDFTPPAYALNGMGRMRLSDEAGSKVTEWMRTPRDGFLIVQGPLGGNRAFLCANLWRRAKNHMQASGWVHYCDEFALVRAVKDCAAGEDLHKVEYYSRPDLFIMDKFGESVSTDYQIRVVRELLCLRREHMRATVLATRHGPDELADTFGVEVIDLLLQDSVTVEV